jgi:hypothetical protein
MSAVCPIRCAGRWSAQSWRGWWRRDGWKARESLLDRAGGTRFCGLASVGRDRCRDPLRLGLLELGLPLLPFCTPRSPVPRAGDRVSGGLA